MKPIQTKIVKIHSHKHFSSLFFLFFFLQTLCRIKWSLHSLRWLVGGNQQGQRTPNWSTTPDEADCSSDKRCGSYAKGLLHNYNATNWQRTHWSSKIRCSETAPGKIESPWKTWGNAHTKIWTCDLNLPIGGFLSTELTRRDFHALYVAIFLSSYSSWLCINEYILSFHQF